MRVLIVEDDPTNQMLASLWFKKAGVASSDITTVNNGQEAVELIIKNAKLSPAQLFDIIYMDNEMPQMGGEEATQKIRAVEKEQNLPAADI